MNKKYTYIFLLTILSLLCKSCLKDDLSNCPVKLQVYFKSVMSKYEYEDVTDQLDLYLYNGMDELAGVYSYSREELEAINYRPVLPLGNCDRYTLLAVVNAKTYYDVLGNDLLATFNVSLKSSENDTVRQKQSELFFAGKELPRVGKYDEEKSLSETLLLYKNTNHIFINLSFDFSHDFEKALLKAYIQGNNGSFDYRNVCHPVSKRVYLPHKTDFNVKDADIQYHFTTMQLWLESDLELLLHKEKEEKFKMNIMDYISKVYDTNEKLDQEDVFYIDLVLKSDFTIAELTINGWYIIRSGVEV